MDLKRMSGGRRWRDTPGSSDVSGRCYPLRTLARVTNVCSEQSRRYVGRPLTIQDRGRIEAAPTVTAGFRRARFRRRFVRLSLHLETSVDVYMGRAAGASVPVRRVARRDIPGFASAGEGSDRSAHAEAFG